MRVAVFSDIHGNIEKLRGKSISNKASFENCWPYLAICLFYLDKSIFSLT